MSTPSTPGSAGAHAGLSRFEELRRAPHWSYSAINTFLNICAMQFAMKYVYKVAPSHTPVNLTFGVAFHRTLEHISLLRQDNEPVQAASAADLFHELWKQELALAKPEVRFDEDQTADSLAELGRKMVAAYVAGLDPTEKVLAVSEPFSVRLLDADGGELALPLIGEMDLVVEKDGRVEIVDWKSSARKWPESKARLDLQPTCYLFAHQRNGGSEDTRFRFDVVTKAKSPSVEQYLTRRDPDQFIRLAESVKVMEKLIRQEAFLPSDQCFSCADCPYGHACASWHRNRTRSLHRLELAA